MFAVIGQKIVERLNLSVPYKEAQGELGSEIISNTTFDNTDGWSVGSDPARAQYVYNNTLIVSSLGGVNPASFTSILLEQGKKYICEYSYSSSFETRVDIGGSPISSSIYQGVVNAAGSGTKIFEFTSPNSSYNFLTFNVLSTQNDALGSINSITLKQAGSSKTFPVIIPQGTGYPATTYEIANVSNFMSKGSSLASCDVSVNISCFADGYGTTYNQAKAVVEALDLYQVTYSEDGQSYTAKFRFMNLDDEYYKQPEKFYKNLTFNCLIIKN